MQHLHSIMDTFILRALVSLFIITLPIHGQSTDCDPPTSVVDPRMRTMDNKRCFFPFIFNNKTYTDCAGDEKKWCPTTCNFYRDYLFSFCRWERKNLQENSCVNLTESKQYSEPDTVTGVKCVFPFVYQNKCYNNCTKEGTTYIWCGTMNSVDLYKDDFVRCLYPREILDNPECENVMEESKYKYPDTVSGEKCVFPFIYNYNCQTDCISYGKNYWCATSKVYNETNWAFCKFLINVKQYETFLKHGLYYIYPDCTYNSFCNGSVVSSSNANNSVILLVNDNTPYTIKYWEVIPQPDSSIIIRAPSLQSLESKNQPAWTFSSSSILILKNLLEYKENTRFVINKNPNKPNSLTLSKIVDSKKSVSTIVGFQATKNDTRLFVHLTEVPYNQYFRFELIKEFTKTDLRDSNGLLPESSTNVPRLSTTKTNLKESNGLLLESSTNVPRLSTTKTNLKESSGLLLESSTNVPLSGTTKTISFSDNIEQKINNLQIILFVTLGLVVTALVVAVATIVCVMRS